MATNKTVLNKGIVFMAISLPLIFIGPAVIHFAFINRQQSLYWLVLTIGIVMCLGGVIMAVRGLSKIMNSLFKS